MRVSFLCIWITCCNNCNNSQLFIDAAPSEGAEEDEEGKPRTRLDSDGFSKFEEAAANMTIETAETASAVSRNGTALLKNNVGGGKEANIGKPSNTRIYKSQCC